MKRLKPVIFTLIAISSIISVCNAKVPSFDENFANYLTDQEAINPTYGKESVFNICIDRNISFMDNIKIMIYPNSSLVSECSSSRWWVLWDLIRTIGFAILFIFFIFTGIEFLLNWWDQEKIKKAWRNFIYIGYWAFLFLWSIRLLQTVLNIENLSGTSMLIDNLQGDASSLFYKILWFFKALVFFLAIIMIIFYAFKIMGAMDQEEKIKTAQKWIINVILALVLVKAIDYIFYIAQVSDFTSKASDFIVQVAVAMAYILWAIFVILIFYTGFLLLTGWAKEDNISKVKNIFLTIVLSSIVIFLFLLIAHQIFSEFA